MNEFLYVFGQPGAGKSTLMDAMTAGVPFEEHSELAGQADYLGNNAYMHHTEYKLRHMSIGELGRPKDKRGIRGTDRYRMEITVWATPWVEKKPYPLLFAEGDRLANLNFFRAIVGAGYKLVPVFLMCENEVAAERRAARGSKQNETWVRGRVTKAINLAAETWNRPDLPTAHNLRSDRPVEEVLDELQGISHVATMFAAARLALANG